MSILAAVAIYVVVGMGFALVIRAGQIEEDERLPIPAALLLGALMGFPTLLGAIMLAARNALR